MIKKALYKEISGLANNEKMILLSKLILELSPYIESNQMVNIYNMKGVGKEVWEGIDAQEYVNKERALWE
ncbi:MAG: hypothetical protein QME07_02520 [bacterium]|nr:hypothetical protein [bacterium]